VTEPNNPEQTKADSPWMLLRTGRFDEGLFLLRNNYNKRPSASAAMSLGIGYMWAGEYASASSHFQDRFKDSRIVGDNDYAYAGAANWCLNDYSTAVKIWQSGLKAPYAYGGLGVFLPILLKVASILRPGILPTAEADQLITAKTYDPRINSWPGYIGLYHLDRLDDAALEDAWRAPLSPNGLGVLSQWEWQIPQERWKCAFHAAVKDLGKDEITLGEFRRRMQPLVDIQRPEWAEERQFTSLLWKTEFFLARHEAEHL
jgi:hypothetical protein